jgi:DNA-binding NarL/FixJ family response regulator
MSDPDPTQAASLEELARCLKQLRLRADMPTYRQLEHNTASKGGLLPGTNLPRITLRRSTLSDVLAGRKFPRKAFLLTFVEACGVDLAADRRWEQVWDRLAAKDLDQADMESGHLLELLAEVRAQADRAEKEAERLRQQLADAEVLSRGHSQTEQLISSTSAPVADALRMDPIRVLVVDDHALFRRGLEMVLAEEPDIELVGEASDGAEAVEKAGQALPDVVLMDIRMPKSSGIEACRAMKEVSPSAKIVMLTISEEEGDLFEAIRAGASGYLLKDIPYEQVPDVVRAVHGGQSLINSSMAAKLLTEFAALAKRDGEERAQQVPAPKLTELETAMLKLVAHGMNNRDIARELFISENTVKNHVRNILEKLQIHSRMEAVMIAVRMELIEFS